MNGKLSTLLVSGLLTLSLHAVSADPGSPIRYDAKTHTYTNIGPGYGPSSHATPDSSPAPQSSRDPDFVEYTLRPATTPSAPALTTLPPNPAYSTPPPTSAGLVDYYPGYGYYGAYGYGYGFGYGLGYGYPYGYHPYFFNGRSNVFINGNQVLVTHANPFFNPRFNSVTPVRTFNVAIPGLGIVPDTILPPVYPGLGRTGLGKSGFGGRGR